jgi:hypothetical protein
VQREKAEVGAGAGVTKPDPKGSRVFVVKLRAVPRCSDPIRSLRGALKILLRRFGLRCIQIDETTNTQEDIHE